MLRLVSCGTASSCTKASSSTATAYACLVRTAASACFFNGTSSGVKPALGGGGSWGATTASAVVVVQRRWCASNNSFPPTSGGGGATSSSSSLTTKEEVPDAVVRVKRMPLTLIEEVPLPMKMMSEIELLMSAWCEEHARQYAVILFSIRLIIFVMMFIIVYVFYRTQISAERTVRGVENMPTDLRIGNVVYFDMSENGLDIGRIVIGLLTERCPLYCEYFHRRCTGNGDQGDSFRGMKIAAMVPRHACVFGDGPEMTHDVSGFNPHHLPTESTSGLYRGALSSIASGPNKESPNFAIHSSAGDYQPQIFGLIIGGYDVMERINSKGVKHGNTPKCEYVIEACGELCTLDKSHIVPMPWKLYHNVSKGMDEEKFGECLPPSFLDAQPPMSAKQQQVAAGGGDGGASNGGKPWWKLW